MHGKRRRVNVIEASARLLEPDNFNPRVHEAPHNFGADVVFTAHPPASRGVERLDPRTHRGQHLGHQTPIASYANIESVCHIASSNQLGDPTPCDHMTICEHSNLVAHLLHLGQQVRRQQHGEAALVAHTRTNAVISRTPTGSMFTVGSSSTRMRGSFTSASASPSR